MKINLDPDIHTRKVLTQGFADINHDKINHYLALNRFELVQGAGYLR